MFGDFWDSSRQIFGGSVTITEDEGSAVTEGELGFGFHRLCRIGFEWNTNRLQGDMFIN
ncbi:hypothetical protein MTR_7g028540 [Medicago truncatula]|uniref:Uncharacterized protein n=1 Tax=Medicago truncatula TaxID=3880 RepID=G7L377_MEDTR|nr:hypothetical protein MTR_7g028540 [Medicago truncatula]